MDRLTKLYEKTKEYLAVCGKACAVCEESQLLESCSMQDAVLQKCGQYEDSGLEPQDVPTALEMAKMYAALKRLKEYDDSGLTPEQAQELGKADAEGRVVVLPCKAGDSVYRIYCGKVIESTIDMIYINCFINPQRGVKLGCRFIDGKIKRWDLVAGKEIFNDRESAEAALAKMKEKNNGQA